MHNKSRYKLLFKLLFIRRPTRPRRRRGYALLMCLMVVAVTSSIVLTLFGALRLQTAESMARRQLVIKSSLADAAFEHAIAILIDAPTYTGKVVFKVPTEPSRSYTLAVEQGTQTIDVTAYLQMGGTQSVAKRSLSKAELDKRRAALGLK